MNKRLGVFSLFSVSLLYGINDVFIKIIGSKISVYQQLAFRSITGLVIIFFILLLTKPKVHFKKVSKLYLFFYSLSFPVTVIFFTLGVTFSKIASVVFAFYSGAFLLSFFSGVFLFQEKATKEKIISLVLVIIGLLFFTYPFGPNDITNGFIYGLISGGLIVVTNSMNKHLTKTIPYEFLTSLQLLGGVIIGSICMIFLKQSFSPILSLGMVSLIILSGIFLMCVVFLAAVGFKHFDLNIGTIITSLELFWAPFFAFFILKESLGILEIIGGCLITLAIIIPHLKLKRIKK